MARLNVNPARVLDSNANPISGGTRTVYVAETTTPVTTYADAALTTPHPQAVPADAAGYFPEIYLPGDAEYKVIDRDSLGATVWTGEKVRPDLTKINYATVAALLASKEKARGVGSIWEAGGFRYKEVASGTTGPDILTTSGGVKLKVLPADDGSYNAMAWGCARDGVTNDRTKLQSAIDTAFAATARLIVPGSGYFLSGGTLNVNCHVVGTGNDRFGGFATFISDVGAGVFAVTLTNYGGRLENVTVKNTGAGNGIWCQLTGTCTVLFNVSAVTTYPITTGSGSVGVQFGSVSQPGQQAITGTYESVNARDYDICFLMNYYSNSNTYKQFYALATNNAGQPITAGYRVYGRGAHFDNCNAESNMLYFLEEMGGTNGAEENVYTNFWAEGVATGKIKLGGPGSLMLNPYGFVGGTGNTLSIPIEKSAYASVVKNRGPSNGNNVENFSAQGRNLILNAGFEYGLGGLNWGSAVTTANKIYGYNSISIEQASASTTVTVDHLMSYIDLDVHSWLRGKTITFGCFGKAEPGVSMSIRAITRTSGGSNLQQATAEVFPSDGTALYRSVTMNVPTVAADAKYLVFRIYASGVTAATPSKAGEIAMPMVYLGNKINDIGPRAMGDGANTQYGNQTYYGGGWNSAHIVMGANHLWVDATGKLRIKSSAPTSDTDGVVVGTQT
jgi:hypothetical protein